MIKGVWWGEVIGEAPARGPLAELLGAGERDRSRPWVAEIVGLSAKYGYRRQFLKSKADWAGANSRGTRGVKLYFVLEAGRYYQAYRKTSQQQHEKPFLKVTEEGEVVEVAKEEVDQWLHRALNVSRTASPNRGTP
ncbi:hypothetical protein ABZ234_31945 [Nocardiopsis sp. NPDC006198]|uniref:hypothetical protein n=1 Tax=Nocardiopsis sp. NPDC006198 TaxID=3154472 RepID=UPI0033A0383D